MNNTYSSIIPTDQESGSSGESLRIFDTSYPIYSPQTNPYPDYPMTSKLEVFDYNYWPTTTHNILTNPMSTVIDQIPTPSSSLETFVPVSSVNLSHVHSSTKISATHHHHHIHQHLYPSPSSSSPTCNDPSTWLGSGDYQSLHSTNNPSSYRHYSTPCSFYPPNNNFYDPSQTDWTPSLPPPPTTNALPIKFEPPFSPPPSYFDSSDSFNHGLEGTSKDDRSDSFRTVNCLKSSSSSSQFLPIPAKNPLNGKTRTRDKYRIVYTDQQRYELENEFVMSKYISIPRKSALSLTLALSERQIKIWFQNRRAKERKLNKKRQEATSTRQLNNSNDGDSPSDGGIESPNYYSNY